MAFVAAPTLGEVRHSVATRLSMGPQAAQAPAMRDLLDEFIADAVRELEMEAQWVELRIREEQDAIQGQATYDWPDNMHPGRLERVIVRDTEGREYSLAAGFYPHERGEALLGDAPSGLPERYEIIDENLVVMPPIDAERYPTLLTEGYMRPVTPKHHNDRIPMDKNAVVRLATAIGKEHYKAKDAREARERAMHYIKRLAPMQSEGGTFRLGGHHTHKFKPMRNRRFRRS